MLRRIIDSDTARSSGATPAREFVVRSAKPNLGTILAIYIGIFLLIILTAYFNSYVGGVITFILITFVLLTLAAWLTFYVTQSNHDLVTATQFQNTMFSSIAHLHSSFLLIVKANGTIVYYSSSYPSMFCGGRKRGLTSLDTLLENESLDQEAAARVRMALGDNKTENIICTLKDVDGHIHNIRLTIHPIPRPSGFYVVSGSSVRRRNSDSGIRLPAAHDGDSLLHDAIEGSPVGLCTFNMQKKATFIHPEVERWLGYEAGSIVQQSITLDDLLIKEAQDSQTGDATMISLRSKAGETLRTHGLQRSIAGKPGSSLGPGVNGYYLLLMLPQFTQALPLPKPAAPVAVSSTSVATAQHPISSEGLDFLLNEAPIAIAVINAKGQILKHNLFFEQLIQSATDSPQQPGNLFSLIAPDQCTELEQGIQETLKHATHKREDAIAINIAGEPGRTAALYLSSHTVAHDEFLVAHLIDTTEQKSLEMKYAHSQKMQAVGQLAGGIAHDFNNLLTAMIGFCDLLLMRHPAGDQSFADIMQIKQNANRAANLVRQLLAFSRRQTLQPKLLDITDVLAELSDLIRRLIGENIELNIVHGRDLGMVKVDQGQLEQVIINLAVNARDAMKDGGSLTIRSSHVQINDSHPVDKNLVPPADDDPVSHGQYTVVEVLDTGSGIKKDIVSQIFEPFFSTKELGSGTGLGLATVYGIIKQTGGHILVQSEEGQGTRFALFFKRYEADESIKVAAKQKEQEESAALASDLTGKATILIVEDETPVRIFSSRALRNKGYTVLEADCAEAAMEVMAEKGKEVEIVISDVIMPGMDGPSMIKQIWESRPDLKVIFISGYAEDALVKMEDSTHPYEFLQKPFTLKQLAQKVKELN